METIAKLTGMTVLELKNFYIQKINQAKAFGLNEDEARKLVQETLKKSLGL